MAVKKNKSNLGEKSIHSNSNRSKSAKKPKTNTNASGGLPEEAHSSTAYIMLNKNGDFRMYREYDENHYLRFEIAYHVEPSIDPSRKPVLHVHEYQPDNFRNRKPRPLTSEEYKKYKKYFKGVV